MSRYDHILLIDWAGGKPTGQKPRKDAIWLVWAEHDAPIIPRYFASRSEAEAHIFERLQEALQAGKRVFMGIDIALSFPTGFAEALIGKEDIFGLWSWFETHIDDEHPQNNRFVLAGQINQQFKAEGPFWGNALTRDVPGLPRKKPKEFSFPFAQQRQSDLTLKGLFTPWQMAGAGAVGSQIFMGLPMLARLRRRMRSDLTVWPFEQRPSAITLAEIWPGVIEPHVKTTQSQGEIRDAAQMRLLAKALLSLNQHGWAQFMPPDANTEGAVAGGLAQDILCKALETKLSPPPLRNDCFALPAGVDWTPVSDALARLRERLSPRVGMAFHNIQAGLSGITATQVIAKRDNPPLPNSAVDGYGFEHACLLHAQRTPDGGYILPLAPGAAEAGKPYRAILPPGHAIRILTGAPLPQGVDSIVLQEDISRDATQIAFHGPVKMGQNTRRAGEDVEQNSVIFPKHHRLRAQDLALLSATGIQEISLFDRLKVGILSTGSELCAPGQPARADQTYDANQPMLRALLQRWGYDVVDLGRVPDDRARVVEALDQAAAQCHALLTTGGASAGDADHISATLKGHDALVSWRIALKPGRPLALGLWRGCPVFGLPGNPVAAWVCSLIFARPALALMAGESWQEPIGYDVPAAFHKSKKPGRMEYLRARMRNGKAEIFKSEGSGRISGLCWSEGLIELKTDACSIAPGDMVRFLPYGSFGL